MFTYLTAAAWYECFCMTCDSWRDWLFFTRTVRWTRRQTQTGMNTSRCTHASTLLWLFCSFQHGVETMQLSRQQGHHWWLDTWLTALTIGCLVVSIMRSSLVARYLTYNVDCWFSSCVHHEIIIGGLILDLQCWALVVLVSPSWGHWWLDTWLTMLTVGCPVVSIMKSSLVARYLTYNVDHWLSCCVHHEVIIGG